MLADERSVTPAEPEVVKMANLGGTTVVSKSESRSDSAARITIISLFTFFCGMTRYYVINLIGEIYGAEILLVPLAVGTLLFSRTQSILTQRFFVAMLFASLVTLAGYMVSDLYQGSELLRYLKGWSRVVVMISDVIGLSILAANNKRNIWWYVLGIGVGGIASLAIEGTPLSNWKFGYGEPIIFVTACLAQFVPKKMISMAFVLVGLLSVALDSRIQGAMCLLVAVLLWVRSGRPGQGITGLGQYWKIILVGAVALSALVGIYTSTQQEFSSRREESNIGRMVMIRVGLAAIAESPIIGYGSWSEDRRFAHMTNKELREEGVNGPAYTDTGGLFGPHSQILQSWVEGGILGISFFIVFGYQSFRALRYVAVRRYVDAYTPIFLYVLAIGLWNLFMSPFAGFHRLGIGLSVAIISAIVMEQRARRDAKATK